MGEGIKTRRGFSKGKLIRYLYNLGDECTALTGGWVSGNATYAIKESDRLQFNRAIGDGSIRFYSANKIDLTQYTKLKMLCTHTALNSSSLALAVDPVDMAYPFTGGGSLGTSTAITDTVLEIDITFINSSCNVFPYVTASSTVSCNSYISKIWLE